jgi:hypothetical protein
LSLPNYANSLTISNICLDFLSSTYFSQVQLAESLKKRHPLFCQQTGGAFMHCCNYCSAIFFPRPQVKQPKACPKCQAKRQRENEKAWRIKNKDRFGAVYAKTQKELRKERLLEIADVMAEGLLTGLRFKGKSINLKETAESLFQWLLFIGIRRVNKLYGH